MFGAAQQFIMMAISVVVFVGAVWALIDVARYPAPTFAMAGKKNKWLWVAIMAVATAIAFVSLPPPFGVGRGILGIFGIVTIAAVVYYFVDVRKRLQENRPPRSGPGTGNRGGW